MVEIYALFTWLAAQPKGAQIRMACDSKFAVCCQFVIKIFLIKLK